MKKWEYMVQTQRSMDTIRDQLNKFGVQGWELVHVGANKGKPVLYMKRPLKED